MLAALAASLALVSGTLLVFWSKFKFAMAVDPNTNANANTNTNGRKKFGGSRRREPYSPKKASVLLPRLER